MRIASVGHAVFAATLIALGIVGLIDGNLAVIWQPVAGTVPARGALIALCGAISIASGAGLLWRRTAAVAARILLAYLLLWFLAFRAPSLFRSITAVDVYWAASRTAVMTAAAWVLYVWFATEGGGLRIARSLYGLAIIPFGIAHFQYLQQTASQVPAWLPARVAWASVTGGTFIAAGVAILVGVHAQLAAALSAVQMGIFLLLVWVPVAVAGPMNTFQRGEVIVTWALTAAGWLVADSYRNVRERRT